MTLPGERVCDPRRRLQAAAVDDDVGHGGCGVAIVAAAAAAVTLFDEIYRKLYFWTRRHQRRLQFRLQELLLPLLHRQQQ